MIAAQSRGAVKVSPDISRSLLTVHDVDDGAMRLIHGLSWSGYLQVLHDRTGVQM